MLDISLLSTLLLEPKYLDWLYQGFILTLQLSLTTIIASTLLAFCLTAFLDDDVTCLIRYPLNIFSSLLRNTPLLVQLFFWYFAASQLLPDALTTWLNGQHHITLFSVKMKWPSFESIAAFIGLTLYFSAFIAEEFRAGIRGIPPDQKNAAYALGLTRGQSMRYIILPQALRIIFSPLLGQYMNVIKSSSLAMAIGVAELSYMSRQVETETLRAFQAFAIATAFYILTIILIEMAGTCVKFHRQTRVIR